MNRCRTKLGLLACGLLGLPLTGATADPTAPDLNHGLGVEVDALNDVSTLSWWGVAGETYFIQVTPDLTTGWEYIDYIYPGSDDVLAHGFATNTGAFFYRLKYTDQPTTDPWNDDFDGDNIGNQDELYQDTDPFAFDDLNANAIPDDWESFWDDQFAVFPKPVEAELTYGQSVTKTLYLNNPVAPDADFTVTLTGNEAEFQGAYAWEDSITGSVSYSWTEISMTGTLLPLVSEIDNDSEKITLTQFEFPHYGRKYTDIWVASDGYLTLKEEYNDLSNETLPDNSFPDGLIAAFWDDLDTDDGNANDSGTIYYQEFANRLIVQYEAVTQDANALTNTFQIVLHADGVIDYFYKELNGVLDTVTVGLHNFDQTQAVKVAYNEPYLQNLLAVRFTQGPAYFVEVSPLSGTATQGDFSSLAVNFETFELEPGTYQADIEIAHTGTGSTLWNIPAILELTNPPSQIVLTAPDDGYTMWGDESVTLRATATDDDFGIDRVEFFADEAKQGEDLTGSSYAFPWQQPTPGVYSVTARAVDRLDTVTTSDPITVTVLEDTDLDRMEDGWETTHFLGLQEGPLDDFDQDGASNLHEYEAGTDPTDDTDTPENIPSVIAFTNPADGATYLVGDDISFNASFSDADFGTERMVFYADGVEFDVNSSVSSSTSGFWDSPAPGSYTVTAIATDRYGASSTVGTPITVTVLADSDGDRMPDAWETPMFGDLSQEASEDGDGDGFPNIIEYHHGSDGNDPASVPQFAAAQSANSPLTDIGEVRYYRVDGVSNTSFEKSTIQTAINTADDFDIIEVLPNADPADSGIYREALSISDRIYLFGSSGARSTTIDVGGLNTRTLYVSEEAVVSGLTFSGADPSSSYYDGGGLYVSVSGDFDRPHFIGCRFLGHTVGDKGGAIYVSNGSPTFISCTIAGNEAASGGAIHNTSTANIITLVNTLLWNPDAPDETAGETTSILWDHSLSRDTTSGNVLIDGADQLTADPGLGYDYSLVAASPARDTGTTALHPTLDLDGEPLTDGLKDIGADEFNDADADGLPDWVEALGATDPASDADGDTLNNLDEYETHWTNPNDSDTDSDQLDDGAELTAGTDALDPDTDGDTLPDGWEVNYGLDPLDGATADGDPDGDMLLTSEEFDLGTNPSSDDTDGDGLKDNVESVIFASTDPSNFYYLDPTNPDTDGDGINDGLDSADGDELSNLDELTIGTDPNLADTDADGVNDSGEVNLGTDPLTNNDFANQDSDNDGLTDLFEINFGTDPYDADTNDNGMNDGEELDNGGDPINPGPPPDPLDPNDPPDPDPFPPPPPPIYPGSYDILIESKNIAFPKRGHATFQSTDPAKRYLTLSAQQSFSGGCPESGPKNISGSKTIEIDPITGDSATTGDSYVSTGGTAQSPIRKSGESQTSRYDDPPNEEADCEGTKHYSSVLSNENTTTMMVTNGKSELDDYEDTFTSWSATPSAYCNVHENELRFDYQKVQFKFKWDASVDADAKFHIRYYVLFIPEDDPDTPEKEDEVGMEVVDTIEWDGVGDESPVFEIDPDQLKPGEDGRYQLLEMDLDIDSDNTNGLDTPDRSSAEEALEDDDTKIGKIIGVNDGDDDNDLIPDYADGFNLEPNVNGSDSLNVVSFSKMVVEIPAILHASASKLKFIYNDAAPVEVSITPEVDGGSLPNVPMPDGSSSQWTNKTGKKYESGEGHLRIWLVDASDSTRNAQSVAENPDGHFVPADEWLSLDKIGLDGQNETVTLFLEGINPSDSASADVISLEIDLDGDGPQTSIVADSVLLTVVDADVEENTSTIYGFDAYTSPGSPWVSVEVGETISVTSRVEPVDPLLNDKLYPHSILQSIATIGTALHANPLEVIEITGVSRPNSPPDVNIGTEMFVFGEQNVFHPVGEFRVAPYALRPKSLAVVFLDGVSNDIQVIPAGTTGLDSNDVVISGNGGILETEKHPNDVYNDDGGTIEIWAGPDGVADSTVNNLRVQVSVFDSADIEQQLNEIYAQAIVNFDVAVFHDTFDWDANKNQRLDGNEDLTIRNAWPSGNNLGFSTFNYNYVAFVTRMAGDHSAAGGFWIPTDYRMGHIEATGNVTLSDFTATLAHEVGHGQRISYGNGSGGYAAHPFGHTPKDLDPENLMNYTDGTKLRKSQWDEANPFVPNDPLDSQN